MDNEFQLLQALMKMVCVGDTLHLIDRLGNWRNVTVTYVDEDYLVVKLSAHSEQRITNIYKIGRSEGFDLFNGGLVYRL